MATVSRSTKVSGGTTLVASTLARAADVETDMLAIFTAHNNHDAGTSKWTVVSALNASATPLIADNSNGTNNIFEAKDNGTAVHTIADGGNQTFTGKMLGPDGTKTVPTYSFSGDTDSGIYRIGANNVALSVGDTKVVDAKTTGVTFLGTTTNDSAGTGFVGEYLSATNSGSYSNVNGSTGQYGTRLSVSLTAGDWDVSGTIDYQLNGATATAVRVALSAFTGNTTTDHVSGDNVVFGPAPTATNDVSLTIPCWRVSIASTTQINLKDYATYSSGTPQGTARISARRVR